MLDRTIAVGLRRWPLVEVCGLPVTASTLRDAAADMVDYCSAGPRRALPVTSTSVNGQVISLCAGDPEVRSLFAEADIIHCDGQPLVMLSRLMGRQRIPERVATTDLYPAVAALAAERGVTFYLLGATPAVNAAAVARSRAAHPGLQIVGARHGYLSPDAERDVVAEIARLKPDILWVALGAPREQLFCRRHRADLAGVGIIKTAGGLFDFLAGAKRRAPVALQRAGLEWLFRLSLEPRRLFLRYLVTNPHALLVMLRSLR
ncbi:WecB/TagA/CpsF family glycosyltransferase [Lichenibacterium ramalinae]|uniref:Glycosyltransferase n=1 Tax=Lichenibacterium ramalinae TaxID=2316527 RepID=A0A4Q2RA52_9HYPH|nr:WecB/TagA/CpsF family glycosyltransferase [Lichenibacterium ramalinae]RYB02430.1 glycosyltransferase [Lichenibacterium ramalinae]